MRNSFPIDQIPALRIGARLSEQLAEALAASIREGKFPPGQRLPTESALLERFRVSRTVVREALSRLNTLGLVESRQGSGLFVKNSAPELEQLVLAPDGSRDAVIKLVEVRRALETESAALAAARRSPQDVKRIKAAVRTLERAVMAGGDGVAEDVAFHTAIAKVTGNPFLLATLGYLSRFLLDATRVTRANESTRADFAQQVRDEHGAIVRAIESGDVVAARLAGASHMDNAIGRIGRADATFWSQHGRQLANQLRVDMEAPQVRAVARRRKP